MRRLIFLPLGLMSLGLAAAGAVLPLLPTVPFVLFAAFCFAKSSPELDKRLLEHRILGRHIRAWREQRGITRRGKRAAWSTFAVSAAVGFASLPAHWHWGPVLFAALGGWWIAMLPTVSESEFRDDS